MRTLLLLLIMISFTACKNKHARAQPESVTPPQNTPENLNQWSGRADYTDIKWQIKSQP